MIKIYQTILGKNGNCLQAVVASLFGFELQDVPHFTAYRKRWYIHFLNFIRIGCDYKGTIYNVRNLYLLSKTKAAMGEDKFPVIKNNQEPGIDGLFIALVFSPKYFSFKDYMRGKARMHAVIIDRNFEIIHDPNPNYKDIKEYPMYPIIGYNGIVEILIIKKAEPIS